MAPDRLSSLVGLCAASLAIALSLPPTASADPPSWNGEYAITFVMSVQSPGLAWRPVSLRCSTPIPTHSLELYERKVPPRSLAALRRGPTVPQPVQFTWDGSSWTQVNDFQWDCMMPDETTIQWNPARADVRYTPQLDGSLSGTMHTEILSGACQGTVEMHMTAERV